MRITVYNLASGRIERLVTCQEMDRDRQFNSLIEGALDDSYPDDAFYIDANAVAQPIPTRLSPNHHFDYATKQWLDPRTLLDFQTAKWLEIKRARDTQEASSFPYLGKQIDSDSRSAQRITTAVQAADAAQRAGVAFSIAWTCADNTFLTLDAAGMQGMPVALAYFANTLHERARALRAQIEAATTPAEVEAVVW